MTHPGPETRPGGGTPPSGRGRGCFIVLEGVEGAGKTTQLRLLQETLIEAGYPVVPGREPGGTPAGEAIREVLLHREGFDLSAESELLLMLAARAAFVRERVIPALEAGAIFLADRFESSTFAYQGYGRGLPLDEVRRLNAFATGGLAPDLVVILDLSPAEGRARQAGEGKAADRIEAGGEAFHARVADGYRALAAHDPGTVLVSAEGSVDAVHRQVLRVLAPLLQAAYPELPLPPGGSTTPGGSASPPPPSESRKAVFEVTGDLPGSSPLPDAQDPA